MKQMMLMVLVTLLVPVISCKQETGNPAATTENASSLQEQSNSGYQETTKSDITLRWRIEGTKLKVTLKAPTDGWVAVGFNPTSKMEDANIIIGFVKDGNIFIRDDWGTGPVSHEADIDLGGQDNITDKSGEESDGSTEISFTIPLDSGDRKDQPLVPGQKYKVLLGHGRAGADNFTSFHKRVTMAEITL